MKGAGSRPTARPVMSLGSFFFVSEKLLELLDGEPRISHDAAQGEGVDRVVSRDGEDARSIGHDNVLALTRNAKARLFDRTHSLLMWDPGDLRHGD